MEVYADMPIERLTERYTALESHLQAEYLTDERRAQISREMSHIAFEADSQGEVLEITQLEIPYGDTMHP